MISTGPILYQTGRLQASALTSSYVRINSTMHTGTIGKIGTDRDGRYILTCSVDKTAKLWDALSGALCKTFYVPSGTNQEGDLYACALSPDAGTVAVGGWTGWMESQECSVYLFNARSGELTGRISGLPFPIADLAFSPDGVFLAVAFFRQFGVRIYRMPSLRLERTLTGFGATCSRCVFNGNGQLAVASADGAVRVYEETFDTFHEIISAHGLLPYSLAFSPNGQRLAVGYENSAAVTVFANSSLSKSVYIRDEEDAVSSTRRMSLVGWSASSNDLYVVVTGESQKGIFRKYAGAGLVFENEREFESGLVLDVKILPDNAVAFCTVTPQLGEISMTRGIVFFHESDLVDLSCIRQGFLTVSADAGEIGCYIPNGRSFVFSMTNRNVRPGDSALSRCDKSSGFHFISRRNASKIQNVLQPSEYASCAAADSLDNNLLVGTNWNVYDLDSSGNIVWKKSVPGPVYAIAVAQSASMLVAALGNGTFRWYRLNSGEEILSVAISRDQNRWAAWTQTGKWDASIQGSGLLCNCINRGTVRAAQCKALVRTQRDGYDPRAIAELFNSDDSLTLNKPSTVILQPVNGFVTSDSIITVTVETTTPKNAAINRITLTVNGIQQQVNVRGLSIIQNADIITSNVPIRLQKGADTVSVSACNKWGCSDPATVIIWRSPKYAAKKLCLSSKKLFVLSVGISRYSGSTPSLEFADKDARDFASVWMRQTPCPYSQVILRVLTNESAFKNAILVTLDALVSQTSKNDVLMLFWAGHSFQPFAGKFSLQAYDGPQKESAMSADYGNLISEKELFGPLLSARSRVVCFFDVCNNGAGPVFDQIVSRKKQGNIIILQASAPFQNASEGPLWGNGVFSKALLEGMRGNADYSHNGIVTVSMISLYVSQRVLELTNGLQRPVVTMPASFADFPIAAIDR